MKRCADCEKRKYNMKETILKINEKQIEFCEMWIEALKNPRSIQSSIIEKGYMLVFNQPLTSKCPQCMSNSASHLNNYYRQIRTKYLEYLEENKKIEPVEPEPVKEKSSLKRPHQTLEKAPNKPEKDDIEQIKENKKIELVEPKPVKRKTITKRPHQTLKKKPVKKRVYKPKKKK
jgi:hypothetical protein